MGRRRARLVRWRGRRLGWALHARGAGQGPRRAHRRLAGGDGRPDVRRRLRHHLPGLRRTAEPALRGDAALGPGRLPDPAQARGPQPHRRPQDPQRPRPGPADQADGQDPGDRRDRSRPARRRQRHRGGVLRARLHRLHGLGGREAPGAQRRADAAARDQGHPRRLRQRDAQGRHQRGAARLGRVGRPHRLPLRDGGRAAPLPQHGPRLHPCHRRRGEGPVPRALRRAAAWHRGVRRRRVQRDRAVHRVPRRRRGDPRLRARGRRLRDRAARGDDHGRRRGRAPRGQDLRPPGRGRPDHRVALDLRRPRLPRGRTPARLPRGVREGVVHPGDGRRGDGRDGPAQPDRGDHPGHRVGTRDRRGAAGRPGLRQRRHHADQPLGPRRQGHGDRDRVVPPRRGGRRAAS